MKLNPVSEGQHLHPTARFRDFTVRLFLLAVGLFPVALDAQVAPCVVIQCPDNIVTECAGTNGTIVNFSAEGRTTCGRTVSVRCEPPSGSQFLAGMTTVTCVASD